MFLFDILTMGTTPSLPSSGRKTPSRRSFRSPFKRTSGTQGSLSATFNFIEPNVKLNQLNINTATEEELMTLPGVSRTVARNIIDYREVIGRFSKVEDLALVSGVGADRLDEIRPEICVSRRKTQSGNSSSEGSPLESQLIDVNRANVFELMSIRGLSQELAAAIVSYRERRGGFFRLQDLLKVKGMNETKLNYLTPRLCLKSDLATLNRRVLSEPRIPNGTTPTTDSGCGGWRRDGPERGRSQEPVRDLYEVVSEQCGRPPLSWPHPLPRGQVRLASWELGDMSASKAANTAVREVFALTLLENRISFVSLQGVEDAVSLHMLCTELNQPTCRKVSQWKAAERGVWSSQFFPTKDKMGLGFLYNSQVIPRVLARDIQDNSMMRASIATIGEGGAEISVLNVKLFSNSDDSTFGTLVSSVRPALITGDLAHISDSFSIPNFACLLPGTKTNLCPSEKPSFNNIYIQETQIHRYTGLSGLVSGGLRHLAIPDGWVWGGPVSRQAPIWVQLRF